MPPPATCHGDHSHCPCGCWNCAISVDVAPLAFLFTSFQVFDILPTTRFKESLDKARFFRSLEVSGALLSLTKSTLHGEFDGSHFLSFCSPVAAAVSGLRGIRPFVCPRVHETGAPALAGCVVLDRESARDRLPYRAQRHQVFRPVRFCGSVCLSDMDRRAGGGHDF
jgi:hypothetical protein